jgi:hypothetical protein
MATTIARPSPMRVESFYDAGSDRRYVRLRCSCKDGDIFLELVLTDAASSEDGWSTARLPYTKHYVVQQLHDQITRELAKCALEETP